MPEEEDRDTPQDDLPTDAADDGRAAFGRLAREVGAWADRVAPGGSLVTISQHLVDAAEEVQWEVKEQDLRWEAQQQAGRADATVGEMNRIVDACADLLLRLMRMQCLLEVDLLAAAERSFRTVQQGWSAPVGQKDGGPVGADGISHRLHTNDA